jgi:hypothetical protein
MVQAISGITELVEQRAPLTDALVASIRQRRTAVMVMRGLAKIVGIDVTRRILAELEREIEDAKGSGTSTSEAEGRSRGCAEVAGKNRRQAKG